MNIIGSILGGLGVLSFCSLLLCSIKTVWQARLADYPQGMTIFRLNCPLGLPSGGVPAADWIQMIWKQQGRYRSLWHGVSMRVMR